MPQITMTAADFYSALRRVAPAISKEETRYYLMGVSLDFVDGHLVMVATDGHRLHKVVLHHVKRPEDWVEGCILPANLVKRVLAIRPLKSDGTVSISIDRSAVTVSLAGTSLTDQLIDGTYPDWRPLMKHERPELYLAVNPDYMIALCQAVKAGGARQAIIRATPQQGDRQVLAPVATSDNEGGEYLLMPMRADASTIAGIEERAA